MVNSLGRPMFSETNHFRLFLVQLLLDMLTGIVKLRWIE